MGSMSCRDGGMVDTRDLKSLGQQCLYGFKSRPKHKENIVPLYSDAMFFSLRRFLPSAVNAYSMRSA